jgi:hypothetical protein
MSIALEQLHPEDWDAVRRNFEAVSKLVADTGGRSISIRFGLGTLTWPGGSRLTTAASVNHGLGRTPAAIAFGSVETNMHIAIVAPLPGSTSFTAQGNTIDGGSPVNGTQRSYYWIAVG